jgi:hypothetical protein
MPTKSVKGYEVLVPELTVHKEVGELRDAQNNFVGRQNGLGKTWVQGEVIPPDEVSGDYKDALDDKDNPLHESISAKLKAVSDEPHEDEAKRLGLPFAGYDEMEEDDVLSAMRNLPSAAIQRVKEWESGQESPRQRIVTYNVGFGESSIDRQEGRVSSDVQDPDPNKPTARLKTRVTPESGPVEPGEGITGTGDPQVPYGAHADNEEGDVKGSGKPKRRSRRDRSPAPQGGKGKGEGGGSLSRSNE